MRPFNLGRFRVGIARSKKFRLIPAIHRERLALFGSWLGVRIWIGG